jgi:hypothetical protein
MIISNNYIISPGDSLIVYEYVSKHDNVILYQGFYKFISTPDNLVKCNFLINNKPEQLWLDNPVNINRTLNKNDKLKIEAVNLSADTHILNINLNIKD